MPISEPGLVYDMDDETYHADPIEGGSLSSTFARLLTEHVPAKAKAIRENRKSTKAMNLGKAAHAHALGAGPELIVWEHDGRTKEGKAERASRAFDLESEAAVAVTQAERAQILDMAEVLQTDLTLRGILDSAQPEVSAFWQEGSVWCRARYDLLGPLAWDYKTCESATARGFEAAMATYGYHQQAEFYQRGLRALVNEAGEHPMRFICQETRPPYLVQIHTCDELAIEVASALNDRAIGIYDACMRDDQWPGFPALEAAPTALPNYYFFRHEEVIPDNLNPFSESVA
jgi:hypothetical protein